MHQLLLRRWQSTAAAVNSDLTFCRSASHCICHTCSLTLAESSTLFATARRVLRLARWLDQRPDLRILLSQVCYRARERPSQDVLYNAMLNKHLHTPLYAIPANRSLVRGIISQCRTFGSNSIYRKAILSDGQRPTDCLLASLFAGIRHLRWIQNLAAATTPPKHKAFEISENPHINDSMRGLPATEFKNVKEGTFLVAHPLVTGIWKETVVLITHQRRNQLEGVIMNKKPTNVNREITDSFLKTLATIVSPASINTLSPRVIRDLVSILGIPIAITPTSSVLWKRLDEIRQLWFQRAWYGGPTPDMITLRLGVLNDALRDVIPHNIAYGWAVPSGQVPTTFACCPDKRSRRRVSDRILPSVVVKLPECDITRHFVGTTTWTVTQLRQELEAGYWLSFNTSNSELIKEIMKPRHEGALIWKTLLSMLSDDLYAATFLPTEVYEEAMEDSDESQFSDLAALLAPLLQHEGRVLLEKLSDSSDDSDGHVYLGTEWDDDDHTSGGEND